MRSPLIRNLLALLVGLLLSCDLSGCAVPRAPGGSCAPAARAGVDVVPVRVPWWTEVGDPLLARLVDSALAHDANLQRQAAAWTQARARSMQWTQRFHAWLGGLLGYPSQDLGALARRLADARRLKAEQVALDYLRLRRRQALLVLRQQFQDQFRDNADIARWRREAGLASAVDGGLAASMLGVNASALDSARVKLSEAVARLARTCGISERDLGDLVDDGAGVPRLAPPPAGSLKPRDASAALRLAALTRVAAREASLREVELAARRNAADARAAYRLGTGDFAAVYAAEASALAARESGVEVRADAAQATVRLWAQVDREQAVRDAPRGAGSAPGAGAAAAECAHG